MKINKPYELLGKKVCDTNGNNIGCIDKIWDSWNENYPGFFFGIKPNENIRDSYFRGTYKLIPIYSDYIREVTDCIHLNRTLDELSRYWNKTIPYGETTCSNDKMVEMPVFDKYNSRVGTLYGWLDTDGTYQTYACFVDPYLSQTWNIPNNTLMPIPTQYMKKVTDTITIDKSLDELKEYWKQHKKF
jgi:hypothetical protein